jgi:hypothetical protein
MNEVTGRRSYARIMLRRGAKDGMRRRDLLLHLSAAVPAACLAWSRRLQDVELPLPPGWRTFEIVASVEVAAPSGQM